MSYTPRRVSAFLYFASLRRKKEFAELLSLHSLAARGDPKDLKKTHQDLTRE